MYRFERCYQYISLNQWRKTPYQARLKRGESAREFNATKGLSRDNTGEATQIIPETVLRWSYISICLRITRFLIWLTIAHCSPIFTLQLYYIAPLVFFSCAVYIIQLLDCACIWFVLPMVLSRACWQCKLWFCGFLPVWNECEGWGKLAEGGCHFNQRSESNGNRFWMVAFH